MQHTVTFTADDVELTPETGFIGFADSINNRYFWLQPGESEMGLSLNKSEIWLERDDQGFGGSSGNWRIALSRQTFTVFTGDAGWLACDKIVIHFRLEDKEYFALRSLLETVMHECAEDLRLEH